MRRGAKLKGKKSESLGLLKASLPYKKMNSEYDLACLARNASRYISRQVSECVSCDDVPVHKPQVNESGTRRGSRVVVSSETRDSRACLFLRSTGNEQVRRMGISQGRYFGV